MRSGRSPEANLDAAAKLIGEAETGGADYVQTPEMTNIMELSREKLFATIASEDDDVSLAAFRELARKLSIHLHIGSLAIKVSPEKAANRSFLIDPKGEIVARYDKIHMFDVDLANGESYRESHNYRPGEIAVLTDLPWARLGLTICYDLRFPALYRALAEAGASVLAIPSAFTRQTGEAHWHVLMRARAIENGCFVLAAAQGGKHENGRETFGHSLVGRSVGDASSPKAAPSPVWSWPRSTRRRSPRHERRFHRCSTAAASKSSSRWRSRRICMSSEMRHDPLCADLRPQARIRNLVRQFRRLRQADQARARDLPGVRFQQGRKDDHGAVDRRRRRRRKSKSALAAEAPRNDRNRTRSR